MNALEYAINMELEAEKYYTNQAEVNKNSSLYPVCIMLANEEKEHAQILDNKMKKMSYALVDTDTYLAAQNVFKSDENFNSEIKELASQLDFYRKALEREKQSIDMYTDLSSKASDDDEKKLFNYLIEQEKEHYKIIDNLVLLLSNAEDWVESAEFGKRKEY